MKEPKAVIFDFDGVICHSEPQHFEAWKAVCKSLGYIIDEKSYYTKYVGLSDRELFNKSLPIPVGEIEKCIQMKIDHFLSLTRNEEMQAIPGTVPYIRKLAKKGIPMAICTNASLKEVNAILENFNGGELMPYFSTIVTIDQVSKGKPSPEGYLLAAQRLGIDPKDCLAIEDSITGIMAAKSAGMNLIALSSSPTEEMKALSKTTLSCLH